MQESADRNDAKYFYSYINDEWLQILHNSFNENIESVFCFWLALLFISVEWNIFSAFLKRPSPVDLWTIEKHTPSSYSGDGIWINSKWYLFSRQ